MKKKKKPFKRLTIVISMFYLTCIVSVLFAQQPEVDRTVLPIKEPYVAPIKTLDARDATPPALPQVKAPKDAPNVVIIMLGLIYDTSQRGTLSVTNVDDPTIKLNLNPI